MKRATAWFYDYRKIYAISIHALVKRATATVPTVTARNTHFNPRPREEGDLGMWLIKGQPLNFNPRPREEGDSVVLGLS